MIRNFADKEAEKVWAGTPSRRLPGDIQHVARRKLRMINAAASLEDLRAPACKSPGSLEGKPQGATQYSNQRPMAYLLSLVAGDALNVEIVDYH